MTDEPKDFTHQHLWIIKQAVDWRGMRKWIASQGPTLLDANKLIKEIRQIADEKMSTKEIRP